MLPPTVIRRERKEENNNDNNSSSGGGSSTMTYSTGQNSSDVHFSDNHGKVHDGDSDYDDDMNNVITVQVQKIENENVIIN